MSTCECPKPPGGRVKCEEGQIAFCIVKDGEAIQQCITPKTTHNSSAMINWLLSEITTRYRSDFDVITTADINILKKGEYKTGTYRITFGLPPIVKRALTEVIKNRGGGLSGMSGIEGLKV